MMFGKLVNHVIFSGKKNFDVKKGVFHVEFTSGSHKTCFGHFFIFGQIWSDFGKFGEIWKNLTKFGKIW